MGTIERFRGDDAFDTSKSTCTAAEQVLARS
eukprot:COSAG02_NODE_54915_length_293_cov_1.056701_2_plen_30_part_01